MEPLTLLESIRESVDSLCRDGADAIGPKIKFTFPFSTVVLPYEMAHSVFTESCVLAEE